LDEAADAAHLAPPRVSGCLLHAGDQLFSELALFIFTSAQSLNRAKSQ
jgi:hypothetical protein